MHFNLSIARYQRSSLIDFGDRVELWRPLNHPTVISAVAGSLFCWSFNRCIRILSSWLHIAHSLEINQRTPMRCGAGRTLRPQLRTIIWNVGCKSFSRISKGSRRRFFRCNFRQEVDSDVVSSVDVDLKTLYWETLGIGLLAGFRRAIGTKLRTSYLSARLRP